MHDHVHPDCRKGKEVRKSDRTEPVPKAGMTEKKAGKKAAEQEPWSEKSLTAWERVCRSRSKERPVGKDYIDILFEDFVELHGDRYYRDDPAIIGGIAYFQGICVTVIAQAKGRTTKENLERNFAMPSPEVQKSTAADEAGRKIPSSGHQFCRYSGCILRNGGGRTRARRSNRKKFI